MEFPEDISIKLQKVQDCRYGENPQQAGVVYSIEVILGLENMVDSTLMEAKQHQGKTMSFNNFLDADAALKMVREFDGETCCAVFKHANPAGVAIKENPIEAYEAAWNCDPLSAFGGIIGVNFKVNEELAAEMINKKFFEAILAPSYTKDALKVFSKKKRVRVLELDMSAVERKEYDFRQIEGGFLLQEVDRTKLTPEMLTYPNELVEDLEFKIKKPVKNQIEDMIFGWYVNRNTKSNTVLLVKDKATIGIGAGQQNRVDSSFIAGWRANKRYNHQLNLNDMIRHVKHIKNGKESLKGDPIMQSFRYDDHRRINHETNQLINMRTYGRSEDSVAISSAFYPFPDTLCVLAGFGVSASLSPSGSIRDKQSYEAMHKLGIAAAHTDLIPEEGKEGYKGGRRAFKH